MGSGNGATQQSAMKLIELGPRMNIELFKVERGMCEGDILYHKFETKTPEEVSCCILILRKNVMIFLHIRLMLSRLRLITQRN